MLLYVKPYFALEETVIEMLAENSTTILGSTFIRTPGIEVINSKSKILKESLFSASFVSDISFLQTTLASNSNPTSIVNSIFTEKPFL